MKIKPIYLFIVLIISLIVLFISFSERNRGIKNETKFSIEVSDEISDKVKFKSLGDSRFLLNYEIQNYKDSNNLIGENIIIDLKNIKEVKKNEGKYTFYSNPCSSERKKYFILLDISGSVMDSIGKDKYIYELSNNINTVFDKTQLTVNDVVQIGFIGDNRDKKITLELVGPIFEGKIVQNNVLNKTSFTINKVAIDKKDKDSVTKCGKNETVVSSQEILSVIDNSYKEKIDKNMRLNTLIGESIMGLKADLEKNNPKNNYSKIVYILFTDGDDIATEGKDKGFYNCYENNCGYKFLNYSENDEAYVFWSDEKFKYKFEKLFEGINLSIN
jgi:hypothetical protein